MTVYPENYYCKTCPHAVFLHNPDGSCGCGVNCGAFPAIVPTTEAWRWLQSTLALQTRVFGYTLPVTDPTELSKYLSWNLLAAYQELGEIGVEFSWKPWAVDEPFAARERIRDEIVDVMHFLGNMLVAMGVSDEELEEAYQDKQAKNKRRKESGTYSARKGGLGDGSENE